MGFVDRLLRNANRAAADAAGQRVRAVQQLAADVASGADPAAAANASIGAGVRQAALGRLPGDVDPALAVSVDAAWDPAARNPNVEAPLLRARGTPAAQLVADDLEQALSEALGVGFDADAVIGVDEGVFEDLARRLVAIGNGGDVERAAVQILARRYGVPEGAPLGDAATVIAEGIAGQRLSLYPDTPRIVRNRPDDRILENPFPERPTSLEGAPPANELFEPIDVPVRSRIPRFEYDRLGRLKVDGDGNPVPRLDSEGRPTFETVERRVLLPHRMVDGEARALDAGEFSVVGRRRNTSDGNRSPEEVIFVLDRGDGTYQVSRPAEAGSPALAAGSQYDSQIVDQNGLGRIMVERGYEHISGPELGFTATAPTPGEAESLGRMLVESLRPGAATPSQIAEVVRQIDDLGDLFDGALADQALAAAGFQSPGAELATGRQLLEQARSIADQDVSPAQTTAAARPAAPASIDPLVLSVRPPAASPSRGGGVQDVVGDAVRRARDLSPGQELLTAEQRAARDLAERTVSGPVGGSVDVASGPAGAETFVAPDTPFGPNPADAFEGPSPSFAPAGAFRPGVLDGINTIRSPGGESITVGGDLPPGMALDTGRRPGAVAVAAGGGIPMPDRLDLYRLSDVARPDSPVLNFEATPGSWAEGASRGTVDVGGVDVAQQMGAADADFARRQWVELSNREAATRVLADQFLDWEPVDDLAEIFRRMEVAGEAEPAFRDLDVAEQFQMASMSGDELRELADDLASEIADTINPDTLTRSQSVAPPVADMDELAALGSAARVRRAADPSAPVQAPVQPPASDVAFGLAGTGRSGRRAREQREILLEAQMDASRRTERLLAEAERLYAPPADGGLPGTPEQVARRLRGSEDFLRLPEADKKAVLQAIESPNAVTALLDTTIAQQKALRQELGGLRQPARQARADEDLLDADTPDDVTDIEAQRAAAGEELAESDANAAFYREQAQNTGAKPPMSLRRAQELVRRALGLPKGRSLPLAFRGYDSRFERRISEGDVSKLTELQGWINKYDSMTDEAYEGLRARNTDLPESRAEQVQALRQEFKNLGRQVALDTIQDADASGANQARLVQQLFSDNPQTRLGAIRELFDAPNEDGLTVLQRLASDPAYGSVENVLYDVLRRDASLNNPEAAAGRIVDEAGVAAVPAAVGPESLRSAAQTLQDDVQQFASRPLSRAELQEAGVEPTFLPAPDEPAVRPGFIDRLRSLLPFGRRPADGAPAGPQVVTRRGLESAEAELEAANTPEEMNAVLARINDVRDRALERLGDEVDAPAFDGEGVPRSARQQILDRAQELTEAWRRRMERIQASGDRPSLDASIDVGTRIDADNAFALAYGEAIEGGASPADAARAGNRARQAMLDAGGREVSSAEADAAALPGGEAPAPAPVRNPRADVSGPPDDPAAGADAESPAGRELEPRKPVAGVDRASLERLQEQAFRNQSLHPVDPAQLAADGFEVEVSDDVAMSVDYEIRRRARAAQIAAERGEQPAEWAVQLPSPRVNLKQGRGGVHFVDEAGRETVLEGRLRSKDEPEVDGTEPWILSWSADGAPQLRQRRGSPNAPPEEWETRKAIREAALSGNTRRILSLIPPASAADEVSGAGRAADSAAPTPAKTDDEVLREFASGGSPDEDRIGRAIDESLDDSTATPEGVDPDEAAPANNYTYEGEDFVYDDGPLSPGPGRKPRKNATGKGGGVARAVKRGTVGAGLGLVGISAGRMGVNALLTGGGIGMGYGGGSAYGAEDPVMAAGDINTTGEPAGSQVRQALRRLPYLTSQNPLPY